MRLLPVLAILGALAAPAAAHRDRCHGSRHRVVHVHHHHHHHRGHWHRGYGHHHVRHWHAYRSCRPVYARYRCSPRFYTGVAPLFSRLSTTFLLDDPVFHREADADGMEQPRTEPIGARFLVKSAE